MAWSKEWLIVGTEIVKSQLKTEEEAWKNALHQDDSKGDIDFGGIIKFGIDLASKPDKTVTALIKDGKIEKVYSNKMPTHDSYTNPDSHIYYQCACGDILDPGTKSFAALNNAASDAGWKVRWGSETYIPYCVECGKDVE